jgi:hypothetical protein
MEHFYKHMGDLVESIEDCAAKYRVLPCLTLLYSGMDVMASLDAEPNESNRKSFVKWVDNYLLRDKAIQCDAIDLYAARCGIVHTFTANSDLYINGKAKKIAYAWGLGSVDDLRKTMRELKGQHDWRCLHTTDLIRAFRNAVVDHLTNLDNDAASKERFLKASSIWFSTVDGAVVKDFLKTIHVA